jgi:nitrate/nitrite transporter NarK
MAAVAFWRAGLLVRVIWGKLVDRLHFRRGNAPDPEI